MRPLLILLVCSFTLSAPEDSQAPLTPTGKRRLETNLKTIEQNIETTKKNLEVSQKNQQTLAEEQKSLETLEKEYLSLQNKYQTHVTSAEKELEKNDRAIDELNKYLGQLAPSKTEDGGDKPMTPQILKAQNEKKERESWKKESLLKIEKTRVLLNSTNESLRKIQARKGPIAHQTEAQAKREVDYKALLKENESKKTEIERLLSSQ